VSTVNENAVPVVGRGFRLQWEPAQEAHVLLYPEGMVKLNESAAAIMSRCDGVRTVADIVTDIERTYGVTGLAGDVGTFVGMARDNGWLELRE
jgi:pyrroloquinoline quinone biosynthesis protein D